MMRRKLVAWLLLAAVVGCASSGSEKGSLPVKERERVAADVNRNLDLTHDAVVNETVFTAARTDVWNALVAAHEQLGLAVRQSDPKEGSIVYFAPSLTRSFMGKPLSYYFDCGNGPGGQSRADTYRLSLKVVEVIDSVGPAQTRLRTQVQANARSETMSSDALHCNTTTQIEKLIATMVAARLRS